MRLKLALAVGFLSAAAVVAGDVFAEHNLDRSNWINCFTVGVTRNTWEIPRGMQALMKLAPAQRVAIVNALGGFAKAFVETPEFKSIYSREYTRQIGSPPTDGSKEDPAIAKAKAQSDASMKQMEEAIKSMPPEMQAQIKAQFEQSRVELEKQKGKDAQTAAKNKAKYEQDLAAYNARKNSPNALPEDFHPALKRSLQRFLNVTAGVDYAAPTTAKYGKKFFVSQAFEAKSDQWKMCYRAGRDTCEALRGVAQSWLTSLK